MATGDEPPFRHVAIAGVGLIGGSIALGIRERWPATRVTGIDRPAVIAHALGGGAIDRGVNALNDVAGADLIVLAAPVRQNVRLLTELSPALLASAVVTDVGGTKRDIVRAARQLQHPSQFVGGHPIGGAERGGFGFARADLFRGRPWILTPGPNQGSSDAVAKIRALIDGLGARAVTMEPDAHDTTMAFVSHLPQLAASALMDTVGAAVQADGLMVAGRGLVDTTRLASSPASVWRDICSANADAISGALDQLIDRLNDLRADLHRGEALDAVFGGAARWRGELMKGRD